MRNITVAYDEEVSDSFGQGFALLFQVRKHFFVMSICQIRIFFHLFKWEKEKTSADTSMVFYFTLKTDPSILCYMGRDKYENEELIKWGWPEDIWFHVDDHSSAHVYIRMPPGKGMDDLSNAMVEECCQLTKQNSIEGCKLNHVKIVYTPWSNLKKTHSMEVGQVGFHSEALRKYFTVEKKDPVILKHLEKTRVEREENFQLLREARDAEERRKQKHQRLSEEETKRREAEEQKKAEELKSYAGLMQESKMTTNRDAVPDEDDFM